MKIREVIKLIEAEGWYQVACEEAIGNSSTRPRKGA
jgi:hypothetical protein